MFDKFKGIQKEREVIEGEKSNLEHLLNVCEHVVKNFTYDYHDFEQRDYDVITELYMKIYHCIQEELKDVDFNDNDLKSYIFAKTNHEETGKKAEVLGLYTGCLLHLLTERNRSKGKRTTFYIDGKGNKFEHLFSFAKEVDDLIIENFKGTNICGHVCSYGGKADLIVCKNIEDESSLIRAGSHTGKVGIIAAKNIRGRNALRSAANDGTIDLLIGDTINGITSLYGAGCWFKSKISMIAVKDISGQDAMLSASADTILHTGAILNRKIEEMVECRELISKEKEPAKYKKKIEEYRINEIKNLIDSINAGNAEKTALHINSIYKSLTPKLEQTKTYGERKIQKNVR